MHRCCGHCSAPHCHVAMTSSPEASRVISGVIKDIAVVVRPAPSAPKHFNAPAFDKGCLVASWCWADNCSYSIDMICVGMLGRKLDQIGSIGHIVTGHVTPRNMSHYHRPSDTPQHVTLSHADVTWWCPELLVAYAAQTFSASGLKLLLACWQTLTRFGSRYASKGIQHLPKNNVKASRGF